MTGNCLKATSFTMTVKTILIVIHMKNIKSLVILGSAQINFQKYYQKGRIIVKIKQVIIMIQKMYKNTLLLSRESLYFKNNPTKVEGRISHITSKFKCQKTRLIFAGKKVLDCLVDLHETFLVIPIDKILNKIAIVCIKGYVREILLQVAIYSDHSGTYNLSNNYSSDCNVTGTHNHLVCK